ncbi:MAG: DUF116 domain-containing protein [Elusimicrobia bacterium]|nr:DUF116 domain-containing protein [Candidatus Liberimonas magnetica]
MFECLKPSKLKEETYKKITAKKNKSNSAKFISVPFGERLIFVPQCMRNVKVCKAKEEGGYYICSECGGCKIGSISKKSKELGYKGLFILKGGRIVEKLVLELKPEAIVGVACFYEGSEGMELCEKNNITVQFVPLSKDGCVDTDVNLDSVMEILSKKQE